MTSIDDRDIRLARLEGEVSQITKRLDSIDNWLRVLVALQITSIAGIVALLIRLAF